MRISPRSRTDRRAQTSAATRAAAIAAFTSASLDTGTGASASPVAGLMGRKNSPDPESRDTCVPEDEDEWLGS